MPILYWFKNDLRLQDNEALHRALASGDAVLFVYCFNRDNYHYLNLGFRKTDRVRYQFLVQCLYDLRTQLQGFAGNLMIIHGNPSEILSKLVVKHNITEIYAEEEHAEEELKVVGEVSRALPKTCKLHSYWGRTLYHKDDIPYSTTKIPLVSKTYRIKTTKETDVRECFPGIEKINFLEMKSYGSIPEFENLVEGTLQHQESEPFVKGGEREALQRVQHYFFDTEQLIAYKWTRNKSMGMDFSSKLSPYLALGCISPRYVYHQVKKLEEKTKKKYGTWWFVFELVWRDYFIFRHMRVGSRLYAEQGFMGKKVEFENSDDLFERWCDGQTGIPFVDANMRKLNRTGYMSNRGRVNCASFLIHDYKVDWRWGAAYFESKLIDYDVSVNWMNWHMQAFEIWYTNPIHQSFKYKVQEYIRRWIPEIAHLDDAAILIPWQHQVENYPVPVEIYSKWNRSISSIVKETIK